MFPAHGATEGELVVALIPITENGEPHNADPNAEFPGAHYIHALPGDVGEVVCIDPPCGVTVRFARTGTATLVAVREVGWLGERDGDQVKCRIYRGGGGDTFVSAAISSAA
jgi:hypothetical protein